MASFEYNPATGDLVATTVIIYSEGVTIADDAPSLAIAVTIEELTANNRAVRNQMLEAADVDILRALEDGSDATAIKTYRQALRDITAHANWPNLADGDWPTKPE
jgi:hypothetical protein